MDIPIPASVPLHASISSSADWSRKAKSLFLERVVLHVRWVGHVDCL